MINIDSIAPINTAINMLTVLKQTALDIEIETRETDPVGNFAESIRIVMIELMPDDYPQDVIDALANLLNLCDID